MYLNSIYKHIFFSLNYGGTSPHVIPVISRENGLVVVSLTFLRIHGKFNYANTVRYYTTTNFFFFNRQLLTYK